MNRRTGALPKQNTATSQVLDPDTTTFRLHFPHQFSFQLPAALLFSLTAHSPHTLTQWHTHTHTPQASLIISKLLIVWSYGLIIRRTMRGREWEPIMPRVIDGVTVLNDIAQRWDEEKGGAIYGITPHSPPPHHHKFGQRCSSPSW